MDDSILLVDDDTLLLDSVRFSLEQSNYEVCTAASMAEALVAVQKHPPDLAILDISLPDGDGLRLCQMLRMNQPLPVIFLTAHDREMDVILGFERGADDYITKPFSMAELIARVGAVLRRSRGESKQTSSRYLAGDLVVDVAQHEVYVGNRKVDLPLKEFDLLALLISHANEVVDRQTIIDTIWGKDYFGDTRVLDVHIRWLREQIESDPAHPRFIQTVRGVGYKFSHE
ncbi:MAG: response regulator transcription factor [Chloroflexi bacterium]|nr:response regulator transcription factor [Chloroflexota bacterium]